MPRCSKCASEFSYTDKFCKTCGNQLNIEPAVGINNTSFPQSNENKQNKVGCTKSFFIIAGLIILYFIVVRISTPEDPIDVNKSAYYAAQFFVKENLVSPASAEFPVYSPDYVTLQPNNRYLVIGEVESKNLFGVILKSKFRISLEYDEKNKIWNNIILQIGNDFFETPKSVKE